MPRHHRIMTMAGNSSYSKIQEYIFIFNADCQYTLCIQLKLIYVSFVDIDCDSFAYLTDFLDFPVRSASTRYPGRPSVSVSQRAAIVFKPGWFLFGFTVHRQWWWSRWHLFKGITIPRGSCVDFLVWLGGDKSLELVSGVHKFRLNSTHVDIMLRRMRFVYMELSFEDVLVYRGLGITQAI